MGGIMRDTHNKSLNMLNTIIAVISDSRPVVGRVIGDS